MTRPSIPVKKDTAPPAIVKLAEDWLYDQAEVDPDLRALLEEQGCFGQFPLNDHIPDEWLDALACDLDGAISDRLIEWLRTLKEGRPPTQCVVEWEHRELIDIDDAKEIAANQGHRW